MCGDYRLDVPSSRTGDENRQKGGAKHDAERWIEDRGGTVSKVCIETCGIAAPAS